MAVKRAVLVQAWGNVAVEWTPGFQTWLSIGYSGNGCGIWRVRFSRRMRRGFGRESSDRFPVLRRPLGSRRRLPPQASRYIPESSPYAPKATFGSVPCVCVLVSPLYYKPSVNTTTLIP